MEKKYWYINEMDNDKQEGPFTFQEFLTKQIKSNTKIWHENLADWTDFNLIPEYEIYKNNNKPKNTVKIKEEKEDTYLNIAIIIGAIIIVTWSCYFIFFNK
jgi:hypothetical protein